MSKPRAFVMGEFGSKETLVDTATRMRIDGFAALDAHSPYPLPELDGALALPTSRIPWLAFGGGMSGVAFGYLMQWWTAAVDFPINVANRPYNAAPSFVPICFELGVLFSALSIFFGLLFTWRLPRPHHPVFEVEEFRSASSDKLWLSVELTDPGDAPRAEARLREWGALSVSVVEGDAE